MMLYAAHLCHISMVDVSRAVTVTWKYSSVLTPNHSGESRNWLSLTRWRARPPWETISLTETIKWKPRQACSLYLSHFQRKCFRTGELSAEWRLIISFISFSFMRNFVIVKCWGWRWRALVEGGQDNVSNNGLSHLSHLLPSSQQEWETVHPGDLLCDHLLLRVHRHHLLSATQKSLQ